MTNVNPENKANSGLPLRGLAMVLIAVAVLLALWGLYASTQNSSSGEGDAAIASATETVATQQTRQTQPTEPVDDEAAPETDADRDGESSENKENTDNTEKPGAGHPAGTPAAPAAPMETERLNVLNNSTVPNLAADVADHLRADGFKVGEVGNLPDRVLPETTVFFQPGNPATEQRARELADRVGGVAREYEGFLPENTAGRNDLTLVLVNQVTL